MGRYEDKPRRGVTDWAAVARQFELEQELWSLRAMFNAIVARLSLPHHIVKGEITVSIIKDAIDVITSLAQKASLVGAQAVILTGVKRRNETIVLLNGDIKRFEDDTIPPAREHRVANLESLATLVNGPAAGNEEAGNPLRERASVWHIGNQVIAILDDGDESFREDMATWDLTPSAKFLTLKNDAATLRDHPKFVNFLVENFRDEIEASNPGVLGNIRTLKFINNSQGQSTVQNGRESMGRSIDNEITGLDKLPETVVLKVRRWADLEHVIEVECLLKTEVTTGKLALIPLADELHEAENGAQSWLHGQILEEVECPVYYGSP